MPSPDCNAACIKQILDAGLEAKHRVDRARDAAQLGAASLTIQDGIAFADACRQMVKAADALSAAAGFPYMDGPDRSAVMVDPQGSGAPPASGGAA